MSEILTALQSALSDRYRIQRELGRGGMATVFLATDLKHDRQVAIKVLHTELSSALGPERFDREIKFVAKLQHPNILGLFDSGEADGLLYYVMPFIHGESLRDRLNRERMLPVELAVHIALEVADALSYAHMLGIVHRDIKPENIMLSGDHALVADFGIARAITDVGTDQKLTSTGTAIGTPLYMSPEQAVGEQVGPTSDIYSLGCMLYEMLAGHPPFSGANARQIMARHAMDQVPSIRVVRDTVPEEVEDAILAAMNKVPADRPQTASQFAELLGAPPGTTASRYSISGRQSMARRASRAVTPAPGTVTLTVRRRALFTGVGAGALVLALFVAWYALTRGGPVPGLTGLDPKKIAVLYFADESSDHRLSYVASGFTEALISELGQVQGLTVISKDGAAAWRDASVGPDSVGRALQAGTLVRGRVEPAAGDRIRVQVWLVDGASGADLGKRASFERPASDLVGARDSLAVQAADLIRQQLGQEVRLRGQQTGTRSTAAWSLVQRAEQLVQQGAAAAAQGDTVVRERSFASAESLLVQAEGLDAKWAEPVVSRARVNYIRSRNSFEDLLAAGRWIETGLGHVNRALVINGDNADALELRGNLQYWKYLLRFEQDPGKANALRDRARADLERATQLNPGQAGAWASLSHLYYNDPTASNTDVMLAARRAYEADAFLSNAPKIVERLFLASYDLDQPVDAKNWCDTGARRFPDDGVFATCQIFVMTMRGQNADPARAWQLASSPTITEEYGKAEARMLTAAVLARAGLKDSARAVARGAVGNAEIDPTRDLYLQQAFVFTLLDDKAAAIAALKTYLAANPERRKDFSNDPGWRLRSLTSEPGFKDLTR